MTSKEWIFWNYYASWYGDQALRVLVTTEVSAQIGAQHGERPGAHGLTATDLATRVGTMAHPSDLVGAGPSVQTTYDQKACPLDQTTLTKRP